MRAFDSSLTEYVVSNKQHVCCDNIENLSDHLPIVCNINCSTYDVPKSLNKHNKNTRRRTVWNNITPKTAKDYAHFLDIKMKNLIMDQNTILCQDYFCHVHANTINSMFKDIIKCCLEAGDKMVPTVALNRSGNTKSHNIPGWNDEIEEKKQKSLFWHSLWKDNGKPAQR